MEEAHRLYEAQDYRGASAALERFFSTPAYQQMPGNGRTAYRTVYLETLIRSGRSAEAYAELKTRTEADTTGALWTFRLEAAVNLGEYADALESLTVLAQRWPARLSKLGDEFILYALRAGPNTPALQDARAKAQVAVDNSGWMPGKPSAGG